MKATLPAIDYRKARQAYNIARFLKGRNAQKVINALSNFGPLAVTDVYTKARLAYWSQASQVLRELKRYGMVASEKFGKYTFYRLVPERIESINEAIKNL